MSILSGILHPKKYRKIDDNSYKLQSEWTSADDVEMNDGETLEKKMNKVTTSIKQHSIDINQKITSIDLRFNELLSDVGVFVNALCINVPKAEFNHGIYTLDLNEVFNFDEDYLVETAIRGVQCTLLEFTNSGYNLHVYTNLQCCVQTRDGTNNLLVIAQNQDGSFATMQFGLNIVIYYIPKE